MRRSIYYVHCISITLSTLYSLSVNHVTLSLFSSSNALATPSLPGYLDFIHYSDRARRTLVNLKLFMRECVYPIEEVSIYNRTNNDR